MVKKAKRLKEIDDFILGKMDEKIRQAQEEASPTDKPIKCLKCFGGIMKQVVPLIEMGDLVLHECEICKERKYL